MDSQINYEWLIIEHIQEAAAACRVARQRKRLSKDNNFVLDDLM